MQTLLEGANVVMALAPIAAASNTDSNTSRFDMSGYQGIMFVVPITGSVATGVATVTVEQNTADSDTGMAALAGASATKTCTVNDDINDTLLIVDVVAPRERYVQAAITSATANIAFGTAIAIQYKAGYRPVVQGATVSDSTIVNNVAEA